MRFPRGAKRKPSIVAASFAQFRNGDKLGPEPAVAEPARMLRERGGLPERHLSEDREECARCQALSAVRQEGGSPKRSGDRFFREAARCRLLDSPVGREAVLQNHVSEYTCSGLPSEISCSREETR